MSTFQLARFTRTFGSIRHVMFTKSAFNRTLIRLTGSLLLIVFGATGAPCLGQDFQLLDDAGGDVGVLALTRDGLSVRQATGKLIRYQRAIDFDSFDGRFIGFRHRPTARVLRFPVSGRGRLYLANLRHPVPRFLGSGRFVRPIVGPPHAWIVHPFNGPWPMTPWVYGYDLAPILDPSIVGFCRRAPLRTTFLLDSQTIANDPLPPVDVQLFNDGSRDVQVQLNDLANPSAQQTMRISPGTASTVRLQRDAGGTQINRYQVYAGFGEWITRETTFVIPSPIRYELVVHEWSMQSIAIDRTGKSPQMIEDVQYQGRGLGRFLLPPGDQLQAGTIRVVRTAKQQQNQGSVAPLLPSEPTRQLSPLERALQEANR